MGVGLLGALVSGGLALGAPRAQAARLQASGPRPTGGPVATLAPTLPTIVVSARRGQVMEGFGASGAWVGNDLIHFPAPVRRHLAAMLFGPTGIALSGFRYNVGGGGVGVTNRVRAPQSFLAPSGAYRWSADPGGQMLLRWAARYHVPELTAFSNSAPPRWTTNAKSCGGSLRSDPASMAAYAQYLATVVRHFKVAENIKISYVSPMNEPDDSFPACNQEGMAVPASQRAAVIDDLGAALAARAPWARVIADESATATLQLVHEAPKWLEVDHTAKWLAAVATHGYDFPTPGALGVVRQLAAQVHKPVWNTEVCCNDNHLGVAGFGPRYDPTMTSGMWLANTIWADVSAAGESAFYWWSAASPSLGCAPSVDPSCPATINTKGWNDGLVYYDPNYASDHNWRLYTTKRFYVMGNFARYVRPGSVRHLTTGAPAGVRALAFSRARRFDVVLIDNRRQSQGPLRLGLHLPVRARFSGGVVTSASENLAPVHVTRGSSGDAVVSLRPKSVTTLTFGALRP